MIVDVAPGWKTELNRGPNWLFIKLFGPDGDRADATGMAETLAMLMRQEAVHRVVLELEDLVTMPAEFIGELVELYRTLGPQGGVLRLAGVSNQHQDLLRSGHVDHLFPQYRNREHAVMGSFRPGKPR